LKINSTTIPSKGQLEHSKLLITYPRESRTSSIYYRQPDLSAWKPFVGESVLRENTTPCPTTNIHRLHSTGEHSDLTLVCGEKRWKVHKCIMSASSDYFHRVCGDTQSNVCKTSRAFFLNTL
jgi:hypothetical protein